MNSSWDHRNWMQSGMTEGIDGVYRFLKKLWNLLMDSKDKDIKPTKRDDQSTS